jgi:hypothetical protein
MREEVVNRTIRLLSHDLFSRKSMQLTNQWLRKSWSDAGLVARGTASVLYTADFLHLTHIHLDNNRHKMQV